MITQGHDIGFIGNNKALPTITHNDHSTIYRATHISTGASDSFVNRSYISFSFGGRNIEDFELIVTNEEKGMTKSLTGEFTDLVSSYDVVDGQFYWGTYFNRNSLSLTLTTDSMTQSNLDDFINWFHPGQSRELIMAEHPNRVIVARVSAPPELNVIPFKEDMEVVINGTSYVTTTTLYKGSINLELVMDLPFWYGKDIAYNGDLSADQLRNIGEDKLITQAMFNFTTTTHLGHGRVSATELFLGPLTADEVNEGLTQLLVQQLDNTAYGCNQSPNYVYSYIYYAGNVPTKPIIQFTFTPTFSSYKVNTPSESSYNTITLTKGTTSQELRIAQPQVFRSYNKVISLIDSCTTYDALMEQIQEQVYHYHARRWALRIVDCVKNQYTSYNNNTRAYMKTAMQYFLQGNTHTFYLDGKNNKMWGRLGYRVFTDAASYPTNYLNWSTYGTVNTTVEDISDVVISDFPVLSERTPLLSTGRIDQNALYQVKHNFNVTLTNLAFIYNNLYY